MTTEELLKPRYKVIADYPGCPFKVGQLIDKVKTLSGKEFVRGMLHQPDDYPANFEPLPWWKDRKVEDMPEYVKSTGEGCIKFKRFELRESSFIEGEYEWFCGSKHICCFEPATKEEYDNYIRQKEDK